MIFKLINLFSYSGVSNLNSQETERIRRENHQNKRHRNQSIEENDEHNLAHITHSTYNEFLILLLHFFIKRACKNTHQIKQTVSMLLLFECLQGGKEKYKIVKMFQSC